MAPNPSKGGAVTTSSRPKTSFASRFTSRPFGKQWLTIVAAVVGITVALVAVVVGSLVVALRTDWGGERLRRQVVTRVNHAILGQLAIGRLSFGGDRVVVWDVSLRAPDGLVVARIARAEVDYKVTRLLHKEVRLTAAALDAPVVTAISDSRGLDLSRAIAPRTKPAEKKPPQPKTKAEGWVIRLDRFDLTGGEVQVTAVNTAGRRELVHVTAIGVFLSVRYATGNGSLDMAVRLNGQNVAPLAGPLLLVADARVRGPAIHFSVDGEVLGGTIKSRGDLNSDQLWRSDAIAAVAIPQQAITGLDWGPLRLDLQAHPGAVPVLDLLLAIPGLEVTAKGGPDKGDGDGVGKPGEVRLRAHLALTDLASTVKAAQAFSAAELPAAAGAGRLDLVATAPMANAPASWSLDAKGAFERLRFATTVIRGLSLDGHVTRPSHAPNEGDLHVGVASLTVGTTTLGKVELAGRLRQQDVSLDAGLASPAPIALMMAGRLDDDQHGLALTRMTLRYPKSEWTSEKTAHLRVEAQKVSLRDLLIRAQEQRLSLDYLQEGTDLEARLVLSQFDLAALPALAVKAELKLRGTLDIDVKADGKTTNPKVAAQIRLANGRVREIAPINASLDAALADQRVDGKLSIEAPVAAIDGQFHLPVDLLAPREALDLRIDVTRIDLAEALRIAGLKPTADGRLALSVGVTGGADNPKVDLVLTARELELKSTTNKARTVTKAAVDLGHGRIHLTYAERAARADMDFSFARGGSLQVKAIARVNLAYPGVSEGLVIKELPVHGKVLARDLEVGWLSQFNERTQTLGGQVTADAQLAGTLGDPQFIGDVRWKNGKVVVTALSKPKGPQ